MSLPQRKDAVGVINDYLRGVAERSWHLVASCLTEDVVRIGPFGDTYRGRKPYLDFVSDLMPKLAGYSMRVDRLAAVAGGETVLAELTETVEIDGRPVVTPEALVFDMSPDGRIRHIAIYIQRLGS